MLQSLEVIEAEDGQVALERVRADSPTVMILDINMPRVDGMEVLLRVKEFAPQLPVIMLTAAGDVRTAVEAMRLGAYDYLTKPFDVDELVLHVRRALERQGLLAEIDALKSQLEGGGPLRELMGSSAEIQEVIKHIRQVATSSFTVLVQGETGTGKELVARAIHRESLRREKPFIAVDCGAIPETLIESELFGYEKGAFTGADRRKEGHFLLARGGTLFLDEIVNIPLTTQAKLLRVLQERHVWPLGAKAPSAVDVRIIAACNVPLDAEVRAGRFRQDLYYRLNEFTITAPPLRARRDDILILAQRFLEEASMDLKRPVRGLSPDAADLLVRYSWPGNVRELRNVVRRAALLSSDIITPEHLAGFDEGAGQPEAADRAGSQSAPITLREARDRGVAEAEQRAIRWALEVARGNKSEAARLLKTDYKTLHTKIKQYGIRPGDSRPS